jgi:hypothetical protein
VAGQLIGWMGDSGNAEGTTAHLHFEIRRNGTPYSPYESLKAARKITTPVARPQQDNEFLPFGDFRGGASIAAGNLDSDNDTEIVVGAGPGGGPHVQIYDEGVNTPKHGFFPYSVGFKGGVDVAAADIDGDGVDEIVTSPGAGGGPHIRIFKSDGTALSEFMAYSNFLGGVKVSAADLNGDGRAEIVTAPNRGGGPHVKVFSLGGNTLAEFFAYDPSFRAGIDVGAAKSGTSGRIVTGPATGGGPHVKIFDMQGQMQKEFMAYDPAHRGGVRVSMVNRSQTPQDKSSQGQCWAVLT